MVDKYIEQFLRTERWFKRLMDGTRTRPKFDSIDAEYYIDDLYSFFINCYHLKDWIERDASIPYIRSEIEAYIDTNDHLKLCADLCNSSKHLILRNQGRSQRNPRVGEPLIRHSIGINTRDTDAQSPLLIGIRGVIVETHDNKYMEALDLASECLNAWTNFLLAYVSSRVMNSIKCFSDQSMDGSYFSSKESVMLPKLSEIETINLKAHQIGNIIEAKSYDKNIMVIVRLKAQYAHGEDREKTRGGILHGKFEDLSFSTLEGFIHYASQENFVWLILAMDEEAKVNEMAKYLNVHISNIEQLARLEDALFQRSGN
jgi:hypothetical protein